MKERSKKYQPRPGGFTLKYKSFLIPLLNIGLSSFLFYLNPPPSATSTMLFTEPPISVPPTTFTFTEPPVSVLPTRTFANFDSNPYRAPIWMVWFLSVIGVVIAAVVICGIFTALLRRRRSTPQPPVFPPVPMVERLPVQASV